MKRRTFILTAGVALGAGCLSSGSTGDDTDTAKTTTAETTGRPTTAPAESTSSTRTTTTTQTVEPTTADTTTAGESTTEHSVKTSDRAEPSTIEPTTTTADDATVGSPAPTDPSEPTARRNTPGADATVSITTGKKNLFPQQGHIGLNDVEPGLGSEQESPNDETLVLRNYREDPVDIAGSVLHYVDAARTYTFPEHTVSANDSITIHSGTGEHEGATFYAGFDQPVLPDDPEDRGTIELIQPGNTVVFRQTYIIRDDGDGLVILQ